MQAPGGDRARGGGINRRASFGAEPAGHLAEYYRRPQRPLTGAVGTGHVVAGDEAEQVIAIAAHGAEQAPRGLGASARARILAIAPSLMVRPNTSASSHPGVRS